MTLKELHKHFGISKPFPFEDIPDEYRTPKTISKWLEAHKGVLGDVPLELITDDLCRYAVQKVSYTVGSPIYIPWESAKFVLSEPRFQHLHDEIARLIVSRREEYITQIDQSLVTREFLEWALEQNGDALVPYLADGGGVEGLSFEIDQDLIDYAVSRSFNYFKAFEPHQYSAEAVKSCLWRCRFDLDILKPLGLYHLVTELMHERSYWPSEQERPTDMGEAISMLVKAKKDKHLYHAYLRHFDLDKVVDHMRTPARRRELFGMLTRDEAMHYLNSTGLKNDRSFKGALIQDDLGI